MSELDVKKITNLDEINKDEWNSFVDKNSDNFFIRYEWLQHLKETLKLDPIIFIIEKDSNLQGVFPNFIKKIGKTPFNKLISLPIMRGGFCLSKEYMIKSLLYEVSKNIYKERILFHRIDVCDLTQLKYQKILYKYNYKLDLSVCRFIIHCKNKTYQDISQNFSKNKIRNLKKARKQSTAVKEYPIKTKYLEKFYGLYSMTMQEKNKRPIRSEFFIKLDRFTKKFVKLFVVELDTGEPIAGLLHFIWNKKIIYSFGGFNRNYKRLMPNDLLHEYTIKYCLENKLEHYDMGGTTADFSDTLFKYKSQWGGQIYPILRFEKINPAFLNFFISIYKKIKGLR